MPTGIPLSDLVLRSAPGEARTPSLLFRRQTLYPIELQVQLDRNYSRFHSVVNEPDVGSPGISVMDTHF